MPCTSNLSRPPRHAPWYGRSCRNTGIFQLPSWSFTPRTPRSPLRIDNAASCQIIRQNEATNPSFRLRSLHSLRLRRIKSAIASVIALPLFGAEPRSLVGSDRSPLFASSYWRPADIFEGRTPASTPGALCLAGTTVFEESVVRDLSWTNTLVSLPGRSSST